MKHKYLLLLLICFFSNKIFCMGAGIQIESISPLRFNQFSLDKAMNYSTDYEFICLGTMKSDRYPIIFGAGLNIGLEEEQSYIGSSGFLDFPYVDQQIKNNWNINFGSGLSYNFKYYIGKTDFNYSIGGRLFLGTNWILSDNYYELYIQQNLETRYVFYSMAGNKIILCFPTDIGIRWHF